MDITALCAIAALALNTTDSGGFVAVTFFGDVISIDHTTGSGQLIGSNGFFMNALEIGPDGRLIAGAASDPPGGSSQFLQINPDSGQATLLGTFGTPQEETVRSMTFAPDGDMFFFTADPTVSLLSLWSAPSPEDADQAVLIADVSDDPLRVTGMTLSSTGILYGWDLEEGLITIDPETGSWNDVNPFVGKDANIQSIAFAPDGTLYGVHNDLFTIDLATGVATMIGPTGFTNVRGMAWVPSPGAMVMLVAAAFSGICRTRRR